MANTPSNPSRSVLVSLLALAPTVVAQTTRVLPDDAVRGDVAGSVLSGIDAVAPFRWQQAWSAAQVAPNQVTLQQIEFRGDGGPEYADAFVGTRLNNVALSLSLEYIAPRWLSATFADNVRQPQTTVFAGNLSLPIRPALAPNTPSPWIAIPLAQPYVAVTQRGGALVMDMTGIGNGYGGPVRNRVPSPLPYPFDAGDTASSDGLVRSFGMSSAGVLQSQIPYRGSAIDLGACGAGALVALGLRRALPALDLGPLGAPGQVVHIVPVAVLPSITRSNSEGGVCRRSTLGIAVPDRAEFEGARLYAQMLYPSPGTNPLGLVVTNALELTVASAPYYDSAAVFGDSTESVASSRPEFAPVVRFTGVFQ